MSEDGLSTFVECGSCTPERQHGRRVLDPVIRINLAENKVEEVNRGVTPGVTETIANLLQR